MQIVRVKRKKENLFLPLTFPQKIVGKKFTYFIYGEGYVRTSSYEMQEEELPDEWTELTWLDIMYIHEKYGVFCSEVYAKNKCAGIIAKDATLSRFFLFKKVKHLIVRETDTSFFELVLPDYLLSCFGVYTLDIVEMDNRFGKSDSEYRPDLTTYRGKPCSMADYIKIKFGERFAQIVKAMISESFTSKV